MLSRCSAVVYTGSSRKSLKANSRLPLKRSFVSAGFLFLELESYSRDLSSIDFHFL